MRYENVETGIFRKRPNRFIAHVEICGREEICHVKNTGRCRELLIPGTTVFVSSERLINMDSQAPNQAVEEWLRKGELFGKDALVKRENVYGNSRFDFYIETKDRKIFMEVKGVTLEENGVVRFPDAPTQRGVKHIQELCQCIKDGYEAYIMFVIQMENVKYFAPNDITHPEFGQALREAEKEGVKILAYDCIVRKDLINLSKPVRVLLANTK